MARDYRIDSIKGLLIILVILGHFINALDNTNFVNHGVMGCIYIFHMPLFILLSGYFTKHPSQNTASNLWRGVGNLFITLVIFHVLASYRIYLIVNEFIAPLKMFPFGVLWYLLSLICWRIMLFYTPKSLLNKPALYLIIALVISVLSGLTDLGLFMSIQRTLNFYVFFLLGFYYRQGYANTSLWHNNKLHGIVVIVLLPLIFWLYPRCGNIMNGADHYGIQGIPEKLMILACSVEVSLLVFNLMPDIKWLRPIGKDSLFYFVYHMFIAVIVNNLFVEAYNWPRTLPFIIMYTAFTVVVLWLMSKVKAFWWLMHPTFRIGKK